MSREKLQNVKEVIDRLKMALKVKTDTELAKHLGVNQSTISVWKTRKSINWDLIITKCKDINIDWLLTGEGEMFRKKQDSVEFVPAVAVPIISAQVPAGFPAMPPEDDYIEDYLYVPGVPKNSYAVKVKGNSMYPTIKDGEYVIFVPCVELKNGDVVIVRNEWNEVMLKRYRVKDGEVFLTSDNPEYPTVKPNGDYKIIGRVIKKVRVEEV